MSSRSRKLLESWLDSRGIRHVAGMVLDADGNWVEVCDDSTWAPSENDDRAAIDFKALTAANLSAAFDEWTGLMAYLGYEQTPPVDRGPLPLTKMANHSSFELVVLRHKDFRRAPDPTSADWARWMPVIDREVRGQWHLFNNVCRRHMLEEADLKTYAMVWATSHASTADPRGPNGERRLLRAQIRQRFHEFFQTLRSKELPDVDAVECAGLELAQAEIEQS